ncbi:MAG: hypothetical protein ACXWG8_09155 [Usitatibacter sp.]
MSIRLRGALWFLGGGVIFWSIAYWGAHPTVIPVSFRPHGFGAAILMGVPGAISLVGLVELTTGRSFGQLEAWWSTLAWWKQGILGTAFLIVGGALAITTVGVVLG